VHIVKTQSNQMSNVQVIIPSPRVQTSASQLAICWLSFASY